MNDKEENHKPKFAKCDPLGGNPREESIMPQPMTETERSMLNE